MNRKGQYVRILLIVSIFISAITFTNYASALTTRNFAYIHDNHCTVRFNCIGVPQICGNHVCAPGEWDKLQANLTAAQESHVKGINATKITLPSIVTPTTNATSVSLAVCDSVKNVLTGAGVPSTSISKVMSDLGCS